MSPISLWKALLFLKIKEDQIQVDVPDKQERLALLFKALSKELKKHGPLFLTVDLLIQDHAVKTYEAQSGRTPVCSQDRE